MGQTPVIKSIKSVCGHSNVDSAPGNVERCRRLQVLGLALLVASGLFFAAGCVETAECNATVSCPDEQVCFAYTCRDVCETDGQCGDGESCTPCAAEGAQDDEGECFGEALQACVPES